MCKMQHNIQLLNQVKIEFRVFLLLDLLPNKEETSLPYDLLMTREGTDQSLSQSYLCEMKWKQ